MQFYEYQLNQINIELLVCFELKDSDFSVSCLRFWAGQRKGTMNLKELNGVLGVLCYMSVMGRRLEINKLQKFVLEIK